MASLFQKIRTLVLGNLHSLADKAIETNSLAVYDQYIRQAEREIEEYKVTIRPIFGQVKTSLRRRKELADRAAKLDIMIDKYLMQGKKTEAIVTQKRFASAMQLVKMYDNTLETQVGAAEKLKDVLTKLDGRLEMVKMEREELGFLLELAKAKEVSTKAMKSLDGLMGAGDTELATAAESIRSRLDHADAAWEIQTESLDDQMDSAIGAVEVDAELAERMKRLGLD